MREAMKAKADKMINVYLALQNTYKWRANDISLRFAAFVYAASDKEFDAEAFQKTIDAIRRNTGYFSYYRSTLIYALAAQLTTTFDDTEKAFKEVLKINAGMLHHKFINSSYLGVASYAIHAEGFTMENGAEDRIIKAHEIYRHMRDKHIWMTGPDDYVSAALLAGLPGQPEEIASAADDYYKELRGQGFFMSNGLQFLSHLLVLSGKPPQEAATACRGISDFLKQNKLSVSSMYFGAIGLLVALGPERDRALADVAETVEYMKYNWNFKWFFKEMNVLIITSLVTVDHARDKIRQSSNAAVVADVTAQILETAITAAIIAASAAAASAAVTGASTN